MLFPHVRCAWLRVPWLRFHALAARYLVTVTFVFTAALLACSGGRLIFRDKWLKDDGVMFPSHASMRWAAVDDQEEKLRKDNEYAR